MMVMMMMMMMMTLRVEWWLTDDGLAPMGDSFRSANFVKTEIFHNARPGYCVINGFSTISTASSCLARRVAIATLFLLYLLYISAIHPLLWFSQWFWNSKLSPVLHLLENPCPLVHLSFSKISPLTRSLRKDFVSSSNQRTLPHPHQHHDDDDDIGWWIQRIVSGCDSCGGCTCPIPTLTKLSSPPIFVTIELSWRLS